jgi:hypothetical protein
VLAHVLPDMPAAVKALLHTWAHKPASNSMRVGIWQVERRSLRSGVPADSRRPEGVEPQRAIRIGVNELGEWLVVTWTTAGAAQAFLDSAT